MSSSPASLSSHCGVCAIHENIKLCAGCKAIQYCSVAHQARDWPSHKKKCHAVKKAETKCAREEQKLRDDPELGDPFTEDVGHFWGIHETRTYMRARFALADALIELSTYESVDQALNHFMDMLRLCRSDNMGVRDLVLFLMLRVGKDQQCYDFLKWWETSDPDGRYDWGDMDLPYLNIADADVFEPVKACLGKYPQLANVVAATLLKVKLLVDLKAVKNAQEIQSKAPPEIVDQITDCVRKNCRTKIISETPILTLKPELDSKIKTLEQQIAALVEATHKQNPHYWKALLNYNPNASVRPPSYSPRSPEEAKMILGYSYAAWKEADQALSLIRMFLDRSGVPLKQPVSS